MKRVLRIKLISVEVENDYELQFKNDGMEESIELESDGHTFIGSQAGESFMFVSLNSNLRNISPAMQFLYWTNIAWQGFSAQLPMKLQEWMGWFLAVKVTAASYASAHLKKSLDRQEEVESGMINFKNYDPELFDPKHKYFSTN